jgi:prepilin-type N-terminal cleavage/methylation domain-containing protein
MKVHRLLAKSSGEAGFSLVELMVVILIMVVLLGAIGAMIQSTVKSSAAYYGIVKVGEAGTEALNIMVRQIRTTASISPTSTSDTLLFAANLEGDTDSGGNDINEKVQYKVVDGILQKGSCPTGEDMPVMEDWIEGCDQLTLTYWISDSTTKSLVQIVPGSEEWNVGGNLLVKRIDIEITLSIGTAGGEGVQKTFVGSVGLRNTLVDMF